MAPVTMGRSHLDDDDDLTLYDPEWLARGKKVVRDGDVVRTSIMLMDGVPNLRPMLNDASRHRPHQLVSDSAQVRDAEREARARYEARNDFLRDAWRGSSAPPPLAVRDGESARDAWIRQLGEVWRASPNLPARDPEDGEDPKVAAAVETQRRRWNAESPTKDAALTDRDASYGEYIQRLTTAWMRPYGTIR